MDFPAAQKVVAFGAAPLLLPHERVFVGLRDGFAFAHQKFVHKLVPDDGGTFASVIQLQAQLVLHALAERSKLYVVFGHAPDADGRSL